MEIQPRYPEYLKGSLRRRDAQSTPGGQSVKALVETHPYPGGGFFIEDPGWLGGGSVMWPMSILGLSHPKQLDDLAASVPPGAYAAYHRLFDTLEPMFT